jgi:hypothetical protein
MNKHGACAPCLFNPSKLQPRVSRSLRYLTALGLCSSRPRRPHFAG